MLTEICQFNVTKSTDRKMICFANHSVSMLTEKKTDFISLFLSGQMFDLNFA